MDSQQNFPSNLSPNQNQSTPPFGAAPSSFNPAPFGSTPASMPAPTDQFPQPSAPVNQAFNIPPQPASFTQPSQPQPMNQPFVPASPAPATPVPPPPSSPDIGVRTMASDAESLRVTGGSEAIPQILSTSPAGPNEPVFTPDVVNLAGGSKPGSPRRSRRWLTTIIVGLVLILGVFLAFRYVVLPRMCPVCEICTPVEEPVIPPPEEVVVPTRAHTSYFTIAPDRTENIQLDTVSLLNIKERLSQIPSEMIQPSTVIETVISDSAGPITLPIYFNTVFPGDIPEPDLVANFEEDFTPFVYYSASSNPFPGIIARVRSGILADTYEAIGTRFEGSSQFANLFLTDTGNFGSFDDSSIDPTKLVRFARGSNSQRIEYGFFQSGENTYWVITTSYDAIKEAVRRLGI